MDLPWGFSLGWGWNPVVFFIILVLSVTLAWAVTRNGNWRIIWILPALVLYVGLDWSIGGDLGVISLMGLFKLVFWVVLWIAVAMAVFLPGSTRASKAPLIMMSALVAVCMVLALALVPIAWVGDFFSSPDDVPSSATKQKDEADPTEPAATCPARFVQELDDNNLNRFASEGFEGLAPDKRREHLEAIREDYRFLAFFGESLFKRLIDEKSLVTADEGCLNAKGRALYLKVEGALMASSVKNGEAPSDGINSGMEDGKPVVAGTRGIRGDRSATIYTLRDGTKLIVLDRCGNIVFTSKPKGVPEGQTDNPKPKPPKPTKPPKHPPTTPPGEGGCKEIPGNGVVECGPKTPSEEPAQQNNVPEQATGKNPGTGGAPASPPSAQPPRTYTPPPPPSSGSGSGGGGGGSTPPPPRETSAPSPQSPEPSPTQDPCSVNPDWCD